MKSLFSVWTPEDNKNGIKVKGKYTEDDRNYKTLSENNVKIKKVKNMRPC